MRFARRFRVKRAWRQRLDECLFILGPVPEMPQPADDGRARIPMRVRLDNRIRRNFQLDRVQARLRRVTAMPSERERR